MTARPADVMRMQRGTVVQAPQKKGPVPLSKGAMLCAGGVGGLPRKRVGDSLTDALRVPVFEGTVADGSGSDEERHVEHYRSRVSSWTAHMRDLFGWLFCPWFSTLSVQGPAGPAGHKPAASGAGFPLRSNPESSVYAKFASFSTLPDPAVASSCAFVCTPCGWSPDSSGTPLAFRA